MSVKLSAELAEYLRDEYGAEPAITGRDRGTVIVKAGADYLLIIGTSADDHAPGKVSALWRALPGGAAAWISDPTRSEILDDGAELVPLVPAT